MTNPMSPEELRACRERAEAATVAVQERDEQIARLKDALVASATGARAATHARDSAACELDDIATMREMACATRIFGHDHPEFHDLSNAEWVAELLNAYEKDVRK